VALPDNYTHLVRDLFAGKSAALEAFVPGAETAVEAFVAAKIRNIEGGE